MQSAGSAPGMVVALLVTGPWEVQPLGVPELVTWCQLSFLGSETNKHSIDIFFVPPPTYEVEPALSREAVH